MYTDIIFQNPSYSIPLPNPVCCHLYNLQRPDGLKFQLPQAINGRSTLGKLVI